MSIQICEGSAEVTWFCLKEEIFRERGTKDSAHEAIKVLKDAKH